MRKFYVFHGFICALGSLHDVDTLRQERSTGRRLAVKRMPLSWTCQADGGGSIGSDEQTEQRIFLLGNSDKKRTSREGQSLCSSAFVLILPTVLAVVLAVVTRNSGIYCTVDGHGKSSCFDPILEDW